MKRIMDQAIGIWLMGVDTIFGKENMVQQFTLRGWSYDVG
jgi:hypothetical protein